MPKFNLKLKVQLIERGITQVDLARGIGRSPAHVCRIVRGITRPRARDRKLIAAFLGVEQEQLFRVHRRRKIEPTFSAQTKGGKL
jgi:transcriptional regulator with XRE-family HTH domain